MELSISSTLTPKAENYVANASGISNVSTNTSSTPVKVSAGIGISSATLYPTCSTTIGYGLSASSSVVYYGNKTASASVNVGASSVGINASKTVSASTTPKIGVSATGINASKTVSASTTPKVGASSIGLNASQTVSADTTLVINDSIEDTGNINSLLNNCFHINDKLNEVTIKPIIPNKVFADPPRNGEDILNTQGIIESTYNINNLDSLFQKGLYEVLSSNVSLSGTYTLAEIPVYTLYGTVTYYSKFNVSDSMGDEKLSISFDFAETIGKLSNFLDSMGKDIVDKTVLENSISFNLSEGVKVYMDKNMSKHMVVKLDNEIGVDLNIDKLQDEIDVSLFEDKKIDDKMSITTGIHFELKNNTVVNETEEGIDVYLAFNESDFVEELGELTLVCLLGGLLGGIASTAGYGLSEVIKDASFAFPKETE